MRLDPRFPSIAACLIALCQPVAVRAQTVDIAAGPLGEVAIKLGLRMGITIVLADPSLSSITSPGVRGRHSLRSALDAVLRGTGTEARMLDRGIVQIRRRKAAGRGASKIPTAPTPAPRPKVEDDADIVVIASKQYLTVSRYPGAVTIVTPDQAWNSSKAAEGTAALTRLLPALHSTNLGPGRNKLFIRGIADSSFSGPTQSTTGMYLGDVRLTFNAPDPSLNLYDMERFELLPGPQGTLYGASSLGGIVRLVPKAPEVDRLSGSLASNASATQGGAPSFDAAAMLNIPIVDERLAARIVVFGVRAGGYIDAPLQNRRRINETNSYGQRLTLRAVDLDGWDIELGASFQNLKSQDGQYTLRADPPFTRGGLIAQPFRNNFGLGYLSLTKTIGTLAVTSTTSVVRHKLASVFDATGIAGTAQPTRYAERNEITLLNQETRLSGGSQQASWVAGLSVLNSKADFSISLNPPDEPAIFGGRRDVRREIALFGQASRPISSALTASLGARFTTSSSLRTLIDIPATTPASTRKESRFSSMLGLNWKISDQATAFYGFQQGFRPGGLGIALTAEGLETRQYATDDLQMHEAGMRWRSADEPGFSAQVSLFAVDWQNIQADQVGDIGLLYTANVGHGTIHGVNADLTWRSTAALKLSASVFLNRSRLKGSSGEIAPGDAADDRSPSLPNVARAGGRFAATWHRDLGRDRMLSLEAILRYVGPSRLGFGRLLDIPQGNYAVADVSARFQTRAFAFSIGVSNLLDAYGNTFSYGNPFSLGRGDQFTPLRPRTFRFGFDANF